jgi:hypothetical protein
MPTGHAITGTLGRSSIGLVAWGFRKSKKIIPGVRLTIGKRGASVSAGPKGAKLSTNTRGERRGSLGFLGLFFRKRV